MKINVLYVVYELGFGGVEQVLYNYISYLKNKDFDFFILAEEPINYEAKERFEKLGVNILYIKPKRKGIFNYYKNLNKILDKYKFDIIHTNLDVKSFYVLIPALIKKIKVRIVHTHRLFNKFNKETFFEKICMKMTKQVANDFFACGNEVGASVYDTNYYVMNNAFDIEKFKYNLEKRKEIRKLLNIKDDCFIIGNIGRFETEKNHKYLLNIALNLIDNGLNFKIVIVGTGSLKNEFIKLIEKYKLDSYFIILQNTQDICKYYSAFDLFVLPSIIEGLPVVGLEAQCSGLECIFSENITKDVVVVKENCTFLDLNNPSDWTKCIIEKIKNNKINNREQAYNAFEKSNYNINNAVLNLKNKYISDMGEI